MSNISDMMGNTMEKLREMIDVNTVIGNPITTPDGTTLIPVSKVSFGFLSGGTDGSNVRYGGGSGAGVTINPIAFISVHEGNVRMIYVETPVNTTVDKLVDLMPPIVDKLTKTFQEKKEPNKPTY